MGLEEEPSGSVALVVDDHTRPCPTAEILETLFSRLKADRSAIEVIFATGSHRAVRPDEVKRILAHFHDELRWINHDARGPHVDLGSTSRGTPVEVSEAYLSSDYRIVLGDIEPHYFAGYGGGRKSVLPGVSSLDSIQSNHKLLFHPKSDIGLLEGNPVHEDMEEAASMAKPDFTLNVVMNSSEQIISAHSGDMKSVLREGVKVADGIYKVGTDKRADIVIVAANGHPHDINMYQAYKAAHMAARIVRDGGRVIMVAECPDGAGSQEYIDYLRGYKSSRDAESALRQNFVMGGHKAYYHFKVIEKAEVTVVSSIEARELRNLYRMEPAASLQEAIDSAIGNRGDLRIAVMPHGSTTIPFFT